MEVGQRKKTETRESYTQWHMHSFSTFLFFTAGALQEKPALERREPRTSSGVSQYAVRSCQVALVISDSLRPHGL